LLTYLLVLITEGERPSNRHSPQRNSGLFYCMQLILSVRMLRSSNSTISMPLNPDSRVRQTTTARQPEASSAQHQRKVINLLARC